MTTMPRVSIIVRTKNEERWIGLCLRAVFRQAYRDFEVILVDNESTDRTVERAREFPVKVVSIADYRPGKAINLGAAHASGEYLVCLSGHCIPVDDRWLGNLVRDLADDSVGGVYGRQQPMRFSSDFDKRDLITVFGLDRKVQVRDSFFHNANSAFRRSLWQELPFDETVPNIEDRLWGQALIRRGLKIVYEPEASVFHHHGIHQDLDRDRAKSVVRILESLDGVMPYAARATSDDWYVRAIVPIRGPARPCGSRPLLDYTIRAARESRLIDDIVVATDNAETADLATALGARAPFLRPAHLSEDYVDVADVARYTTDTLADHGERPADVIVVLEETYPFRPHGLIDEMITRLGDNGMDSLVACRVEDRRLWLEQDGRIENFGSDFMPRKLKESRAFVGLFGLCTVTHAACLYGDDMLGARRGIFEVHDPLSAIEARGGAQTAALAPILEDWWAGARMKQAV